jgi:hypothetical protein
VLLLQSSACQIADYDFGDGGAAFYVVPKQGLEGKGDLDEEEVEEENEEDEEDEEDEYNEKAKLKRNLNSKFVSESNFAFAKMLAKANYIFDMY